jgi:autotransporter-associated beta strand protein
LHLTPLVVVTPGVGGSVKLLLLDSFTWRNGAGISPDDFNEPTNWANSNTVPTTNQVAIFDANVLNYDGGVVDLSANRTVGGLTFADSGQGGYTLGSAANKVLTLSNGGATGTAAITVLSGSHTISARVALTSNLAVAVTAANSTLTMSGVISETTAGRTLSKSGPGTLRLDGVNTYTGLTTVSGGTLGGTGTIAGAVSVASGGRLRGDSGPGAGTLTVGSTTVLAGGGLAASLGVSGTNSKLALGANTLNLATASQLQLLAAPGFSEAPAAYTIATLGDGNNLQLDGVGSQVNGFVFGGYVQGAGGSGAVLIDVSSFGTPLNAGDQFQLTRSGNTLLLNFTPAVPEPTLLMLAAAGLLFLMIQGKRENFGMIYLANPSGIQA